MPSSPVRLPDADDAVPEDGCASSPAEPAADGEQLDLASTYRREKRRLMHYFMRRAGRNDAADLVQEVFARAVSSPQAEQYRNPAGFLQRIAVNLLIDRSRKRERSNVVFLPVDEQRDLAVPPDQDHGIEVADLERIYQAAVDGLPEKTRRVYLMHRLEGLSYREIHEHVGISVATVEYHMMKALRHIAFTVDAMR